MRFNGTLYQIGAVTRDLERAIQSYETLLGLGPWLRVDTRYTGRYRTWTGLIANRNAFARYGDLYLELVEPGIGNSSAREWLETRGEGIFHLGYRTDDLNQRPDGVECVFEALDSRTAEGAVAVIHLDTVDRLGYFVELSDWRLVDRLNAWINAGSEQQKS